jgi:hypothetical protein
MLRFFKQKSVWNAQSQTRRYGGYGDGSRGKSWPKPCWYRSMASRSDCFVPRGETEAPRGTVLPRGAAPHTEQHTEPRASRQAVMPDTEMRRPKRTRGHAVAQGAAGFSLQRPGFVPRTHHVRFVVGKVALGQDFLRVLSAVSIIPPLLHVPTGPATGCSSADNVSSITTEVRPATWSHPGPYLDDKWMKDAVRFHVLTPARYEDYCLPGSSVVYSGRNWPTFHRCVLPPSSGDGTSQTTVISQWNTPSANCFVCMDWKGAGVAQSV